MHLRKNIRLNERPGNSARMGIEFSALFFGYFLLSKQRQRKKVTQKESDKTKKVMAGLITLHRKMSFV